MAPNRQIGWSQEEILLSNILNQIERLATVIGSGGGGTVTSVSVISANGFEGSVTTATTTPFITISTSITGILKGDGTSMSAAIAGVDYLEPNGSGSSLTGVWNLASGGTYTNTNNLAMAGFNLNLLNGNILSGPTGATITTNTRLDVRGTGTTTNLIQRWADSANTLRLSIADNGVLTHTSDIFGSIFNGTWTATASGQKHVAFGGTFTAFGGSPNELIGYQFNPTLTATGTLGIQIGVDINPSFSGGTTPDNIALRVTGKTYMGASGGTGGYTGRLYVQQGTGGKVAILGNIEILTSGGATWTSVGLQVAGSNRTLVVYGSGLINSSDFASTQINASTYATNRAGASLSILNVVHPSYTVGVFTATDLAMFRLDGGWPTLTTPLSIQYGIDYNPSSVGNGTTHVALRATSGQVLIGGTTVTANTRLDVRATGISTELIQRWADSTNATKMYITADGTLFIGTGSATSASILLELSSSTKGLVLSRMTTTERNSLTATAGMIIYNTTTNKLNVYTTTWEVITSV